MKEFDEEVGIINSKCTSLNESNNAGAISECLRKWQMGPGDCKRGKN